TRATWHASRLPHDRGQDASLSDIAAAWRQTLQPRKRRMTTEQARVLAIDDDPEALEVLQQLLGRENYSVVGCESAEQALQRAAHEEFDVVLSDVHLGGIGGIELCQRMV